MIYSVDQLCNPYKTSESQYKNQAFENV